MLTLSIVIVNYNAKGYLRQCLNSLHSMDRHIDFETIVVDNNSHDGSVEMLRKDFPHVCVIENSRNLGFAKGNNIGFSAAKGKYILMLNSDTNIIGDAPEKLVHYLDIHPEVGVVAPRLVYPDLSDQGVARTFPTPMNALFGRKTVLTRLFPKNKFSKKYLTSRENSSNEAFDVDWVSGACLMVKKEALYSVGLLDEDFFMYWEDLDFCYRIKKKGWKINCVPEATVIHYEGKSTSKKVSSRCIIEFNKGVYRFYRKHHINNFFEIMNIVSIIGLTLRTLVLLGINVIKPKDELTDKEDVLKGT